MSHDVTQPPIIAAVGQIIASNPGSEAMAA